MRQVQNRNRTQGVYGDRSGALDWLGGHQVVLALAAALLIGPARANEPEPVSAKEYAKPSYLSAYDFASRDDLRLSWLLRDAVEGTSPSQWPFLGPALEKLGDWVTDFIDAPKIANTVTRAMPVEGQPALESISGLVAECAAILRVEKPMVYVRSSAVPQAYVMQVDDQHFLVLTSALLDLFDGSPDELRFVVGHELGHIKCDHLRLKLASYGVLSAVQTINLVLVPDDYQTVVPTLAMGRLFSWSREAEISADRAGLLCCQDPQVAFNALLRLLNGLSRGSSWIDPSNSDFRADEVIANYRDWEQEPFVAFVKYVKESSLEAPFIPERVAALQSWARSGQYQAILDRKDGVPRKDQLVVVQTIKLKGLGDENETIDPYVVCFSGTEKLFRTTVVKDAHQVTWSGIEHAVGLTDGAPLFFDIWDSNVLRDDLVGGFVIYPVNPASDPKDGRLRYLANIVWDWKDESETTRPALAEVTVEFRQRTE